MSHRIGRFFLFLAAFLFVACSSSSGFVVAPTDEAGDAGELEAAPLEAGDAGRDAGELEAAPLEAGDTAHDAGELEAAPLEAGDTGPTCSPLAPSCCRTSVAADLSACEAAAGASAPKGWTWTRTANTAFRCSPAVTPPAAQPCEKSYRLAAGELFCCVVGS